MIISNQKFEKEIIEKQILSAEHDLGLPLGSKERMYLEERAKLLSEKMQQVARALPDELVGLDCVQAFVSNMSTATSLEELSLTDGTTLPEELLSAPTIEWTSPKWAKAGDIVFFMHSKTARTSLTKLRSELEITRNELHASEYYRLMSFLEHALEVHAQYGGKVFAIGRVCGGPEYVNPNEIFDGVTHWKSRYFAAIDNIQALENPIDISEFRNYIFITRAGATTPLFDHEFNRLREDISKKNVLPRYVTNAIARPIPLRLINEENWIEIANTYRRSFILEKQFRHFYVDYLLREIGDQKRFFTECCCQRSNMNDSRMDYVIRFNKRYLPVETKLSVSAEPNIVSQVSKYVYNSQVFLTDDRKRRVTGEDFHPGKVLIIDTEKIFMYDAKSNLVEEILDLNQITSKADLSLVKQIIRQKLN